MNLLITSILLSIVALIVNLDYFIGSSMLARPVVAGTLVGFVMGDLQTGIMTGAAIELAFIGSFSIGAAIPPDMVSGTILGNSFRNQYACGSRGSTAPGVADCNLGIDCQKSGSCRHNACICNCSGSKR